MKYLWRLSLYIQYFQERTNLILKIIREKKGRERALKSAPHPLTQKHDILYREFQVAIYFISESAGGRRNPPQPKILKWYEHAKLTETVLCISSPIQRSWVNTDDHLQVLPFLTGPFPLVKMAVCTESKKNSLLGSRLLIRLGRILSITP